MLVAYIDDSGTDSGSDNVVAAGFLSDVGRWTRFEQEWRSILAAYDLRDFHTKDFRANPRRGAFKGWTDEKCEALYAILVHAICKHALFGFSANVNKEDYDHAVVGPLREKLGGHYRFCAAVCVWEITRKIRSEVHVRGEPIRLVFASDTGGKGNKDVDALFSELRKFPDVEQEHGISCRPDFGKAKSTAPLQAADLIAWHSRNHVEDFYENRRELDGRDSFVPDLPKSKLAFSMFFNDEALQTYVPEITAKYEKSGWAGAPGGFV